MANDLMHFQDLLPATQSGDRRLSRAAAQQANEMEQIAAVARIAMNESSSTTVYATCKGLSTVTLAYLLRQEALERGITLEDEGAFR